MGSSLLLQDVAALALLILGFALSRKYYWLRGATYRNGKVLSVPQVLLIHCLFIASVMGVFDAVARRTLGAPVWLRLATLHAPMILWALNGPIGRPLDRRTASGFSENFIRSHVWKLVERYLFPGSSMRLSEHWRHLSRDTALQWFGKANYVIPLHPHGVMPFGAILNGLTHGTGGLRPVTASGERFEHVVPDYQKCEGLHQNMFPNLRLRAAVASGCFILPGFYEFFAKLGSFEVSRPFMVDRLRAGDSVAVMPGGGQESRFAYPKPNVVVLLNRKGFIRFALEERVHLLPMYTFGDDGLCPQMLNPPEFLIKLQDFVKSVLGLLLPFVPISLPHLGPKTTVIGVPVDVSDLWPSEKGGCVSNAAVNEAHARYVKYLTSLFDDNKALVPGGFADAAFKVI